MSLISLVPDLLSVIALNLEPQHLKNFMLACRKTHQSCSSERFWKLKYEQDHPLYAPHVTHDHRKAYKFLTIIDSLSFSDTQRKDFLGEFDVDKMCRLILYCIDISLIYPIPSFEADWNPRCASSLHHIRADIHIYRSVFSSSKCFKITRGPRTVDSNKIPAVAEDLLSEKDYSIDLLKQVLIEAKEKGYVKAHSSGDPIGISRTDVAQYPDIFHLNEIKGNPFFVLQRESK